MKVDGLAGLPHQVDEISLQSTGFSDRLRNAFHQEIRDHAGVKRTGSERNQIRLRDGIECFGKGFAVGRLRSKWNVIGLRLLLILLSPADDCFVIKSSFQNNIGRSSRKDPAADRENLGRQFDCLREIACDLVHARSETSSQSYVLSGHVHSRTEIGKAETAGRSSSESAVMQFRISPGGGYRNRGANARNFRRHRSP